MTRQLAWWGAMLALALTACGGPPPTRRAAPDTLDRAAVAALDPAARRAALQRVEAARARRPADRALLATEGHLRAALGDYPGATDALLTAAEGDADPALRDAARDAVRASGAWARWRPLAEASGADTDLDRPAAHAGWLQALAATDRAAARAAARRALERRAGDPHLLTAAAAIEADADAWGHALLLATRAIEQADAAGIAPPPPARTVRARALAALEPASAPDAFAAARADDDPAGRRDEALFLLRHGRIEPARVALDAWLAERPLDAEAATLAGRLAEVAARADAARPAALDADADAEAAP